MALRLNGSTSGFTALDAPAAAGSNTLVLPTSNGSAGNILGTDGSGNLSWVNGRMVRETAKAWNWNGLTTNTSIDFTGIPSWAKRITVMLDQVSLSASANIQIQLGDAGGVETSGYVGVSQYFGTGAASQTPTTGAQLILAVTGASYTMAGQVIITNVTGNSWVIWGMLGASSAYSGMTICNKSLSDTLDRVRITSTSTDTFDAGTINILYEG